MGQKKLIRFAELLSFPNVLQYPKGMPGKWKEFFQNDLPVTLELACGKGEYTVGLAKLFPERNFIGIDLKGNRIWVGAKLAIRENLQNVAFIRSHIDKLSDYFSEAEVSEIWLPFPDPQLRGSKAKKRLTHPKFLRIYQSVLTKRGIIHLKTDSPSLYNFTKQVIKLYELEVESDLENVYQQVDLNEVLKIKTHYESLDIAQSQKIHYISFRLPADTLPDKDKELKELSREEEPDRRN
ncbi:MAG: tRNA (guanosine(46)-N7)-methyltransferase TrmB [Chitinophagaceae bacterium]|nr:tRNA (guanosine(46)-N7)-methyltransferase TrmB [Chitinophagaceae bacterium]